MPTGCEGNACAVYEPERRGCPWATGFALIRFFPHHRPLRLAEIDAQRMSDAARSSHSCPPKVRAAASSPTSRRSWEKQRNRAPSSPGAYSSMGQTMDRWDCVTNSDSLSAALGGRGDSTVLRHRFSRSCPPSSHSASSLGHWRAGLDLTWSSSSTVARSGRQEGSAGGSGAAPDCAWSLSRRSARAHWLTSDGLRSSLPEYRSRNSRCCRPYLPVTSNSGDRCMSSPCSVWLMRR